MIALVLLLILVVLILLNTGRRQSCGCVGNCVCQGKGRWTVYGTNWCGWTTKQIDYMKKNGKNFDFIDCEKKQCNGIKSFPTLISPNGESITGYHEV